MTFSLIMFYILAAVILFGAVKTVTAKNPVHASLYLVLTFCMSAMMWMLMQAEFLGITLVVVYVGAVLVLFLFVVMMLNIDIEEMRAGFWRNAPVAFTVGVLMAVALTPSSCFSTEPWAPPMAGLAKTPVIRAPTMPPTAWMPNTSRESS